MSIMAFDYIVYKYISNLLYENNHTVMSSMMYITIIVLVITAALYVYNVYIVNIGGGKNNSEKDKPSNSTSSGNMTNGITNNTNQNKNITTCSRRQRD
jgi:hypothetical protein